MACMRIVHQHVNGSLNFIQHAVCRIHAFLGDKIPNLFEICKSFRVKRVSAHALATAVVCFLFSQAVENVFAVHWLGPAALDIVIASIKSIAYLRQFSQVSRHRVLYKLFFWPASLCGKLSKLGFQIRRQMHFHNAKRRQFGACLSITFHSVTMLSRRATKQGLSLFMR
jgi:hypothetical protein